MKLQRQQLTHIDGLSRTKIETLFSISRDSSVIMSMSPGEIEEMTGGRVDQKQAAQVIELAVSLDREGQRRSAAREEVDGLERKIARRAELLTEEPQRYRARTPGTAEDEDDPLVTIELQIDNQNIKRIRGTVAERDFVLTYKHAGKRLPPNWRALVGRLAANDLHSAPQLV